MKVKESFNVTFDETPPLSKTSPLEDDDLVKEEAINVNEIRPLGNDVEYKSLGNNEIINIKENKSHPLENVIVPNPKDMTIIGTKWVYRNKLDENGVVSRNKARPVAQGYNQQEGMDYDESYAPVARLESIRILLAYACTLDFKLFQIDVKSAFLNGFINKEVYVAQPPGFIDFAKPNHIYRLKKALYGLKQAPTACPHLHHSHHIQIIMSSPKNPLSKLSKTPKILVRPVRRKKLNYCNSSNVDEVDTPTPMPKPPSPYNELSKESSPIAPSNQASPQPHSPPLIDPYVNVVLQANQNRNETQPQLPHSPTRVMLVDEINQLQDLSNLLAMHLSNHTTNPTPSTPILPRTVTFDQGEHYVGYCPRCRYNQAQFLAIKEDLNWVEFLLTRPQPPLQIQRDYPPTTTSAPKSPPPTN
nr:copia protein [Tanacetum cinerariifolium]